MNRKRIWKRHLFRFPESVEQRVGKLIQRIPEKVRFELSFTFVVILSSYLITKRTLSLGVEVLPFLGLIPAFGIVYYAVFKACVRERRALLDQATAFWVITTLLLLELVVVRAASFIAVMLTHNSEMETYGGYLGFELAIPYAAAALILALLVGPQLALIASFIVSLFVALIPDGGVALAMYSLGGSVAAISGVERYRTRNTISLAILIIGFVNVIMSLIIPLIANHPLTWKMVFSGAAMSLLSALQATAIASLVTPLYESTFGILTDMKLLELSYPDNPLLREMAVRTPGTNHHSSVVAMLADSAAKAIGANALLARTACLYHDIGKMAAPKMYIENQNGIVNPHDNVDPRDSVRIVTGHVRRGIRMGNEAGLPHQIIDFIPQHHGTRILAYFYHKAKSQAEARGETVNPDDFRYPGPKPQSKEAVIVMLADGAEAAVRSLDEHSEENIRAIIKKIMDHIIADGQFDESDVTLQELNTIREKLIETLRSIHHERVSYPGFNPTSERAEPTAPGIPAPENIRHTTGR